MDPSEPTEAETGDALANKGTPAGAGLRASDIDRERIASILQAAMADGRISADELEERLVLVYSAKSMGELLSIVKDLQPPRPADSTPTSAKDSAVVSEFVRQGRWLVGKEYSGTAVISTGVIDLRQAEFTSPETTIHVQAWIGTVYVVVPEDAEVHVAGTGILGRFRQDRDSTRGGSAHRINVTGTAVCGNVHVVHKLPPARERRLQKRERKSISNKSAR